MSDAKTTNDHQSIKAWVEKRKGRPAKVDAAGGGSGILRIDFGEPEEGLSEIEWDEFFAIFEKSKPSFLYQNETSGGKTSRFNKFISRQDQRLPAR